MNGFATFGLGIVGGIVGSVAKLWIDEKWLAWKQRLTPRELELLERMRLGGGKGKFRRVEGRPSILEKRYEDTDFPELNTQFEDLGETSRLIGLGFIEEIARDPAASNWVAYVLTGKGWLKVSR